MAWLNFNQAQSNSKKWPKKIKLPQMKFFLKKNKIKFSCTYQPLSFRKISKKNLTANLHLWGCTSFVPKMVHLPQFFFLENIDIIFIYLLAPFIVQVSKKSSQRIHDGVMTICYFWAQNGPFAQMRIFFSENLLLRIVPFIHATCLCPDAMQYKRAMCIIAKCLVRLNSMKMPPNY